MWYLPIKKLSTEQKKDIENKGYCRYPRKTLCDGAIKEPEYFVPSKRHFLDDNREMQYYLHFLLDGAGNIGGAGAYDEDDLIRKMPKDATDVVIYDCRTESTRPLRFV